MTGLPQDGRGGREPEWTSSSSPEEFEDRLVKTVVATAMASMNRPGSVPEHYSQAQARMFHGTSLKYFSFFAWRFPSWLLEVASRCPYQDVRRELIEDCVDEEVGDEDAGGRCHVDVLYEEAEACGVPRDEITNTSPSPLIQTCVLALDDLSRTLSWQASFASIAALEIINSKPAVEMRMSLMSEADKAAAEAAISTSLPDRLGIPGEDMLFNALHAYKDQFHGGGELELLVKYGSDALIQDEMLWGAKTAIEIFGIMYTEIQRLATEAADAVTS